MAKTLGVTALAGSGHVVVTALLGLLIAWFGIALSERIGMWFPRIAGAALLLLGRVLSISAAHRQGARASPSILRTLRTPTSGELEHEHDHAATPVSERPRGSVGPGCDHEPAHAADLFALRSVSADLCLGRALRLGAALPCSRPYFRSAQSLGMVLFTWLTLAGVQKVKLGLLEKYESGLIGALLCTVGL